MADADDFAHEPRSEGERRALFWALVLNVGLAATLAVVGIVADSSALIANAVDNASDAAVYGISLCAVGRDPGWKRAAAMISGIMLLVVAAGVMADVIRRILGDPEPAGMAIIMMALVAAIINVLCLYLLRANRKDDVNLRAAWTFSINDLVSNIGVLVAGALVYWLARAWPDLVIGFAIAAIATKGGIEILRWMPHESAAAAWPSSELRCRRRALSSMTCSSLRRRLDCDRSDSDVMGWPSAPPSAHA